MLINGSELWSRQGLHYACVLTLFFHHGKNMPRYCCPVTWVRVTLYELFLPQTQAWKSGGPRQPNHADARLLIRRPILVYHWGSTAAYHPLKIGWVQEFLPFDIVATLSPTKFILRNNLFEVTKKTPTLKSHNILSKLGHIWKCPGVHMCCRILKMC